MLNEQVSEEGSSAWRGLAWRLGVAVPPLALIGVGSFVQHLLDVAGQGREDVARAGWRLHLTFPGPTGASFVTSQKKWRQYPGGGALYLLGGWSKVCCVWVWCRVCGLHGEKEKLSVERKELCTSDWKQAICLHKSPVLEPKLWFKGRVWASRRENGCIPAVPGFLVQSVRSSPALQSSWGSLRQLRLGELKEGTGRGKRGDGSVLHPEQAAPKALCLCVHSPSQGRGKHPWGLAWLPAGMAWGTMPGLWRQRFRGGTWGHGWWGCSVFKTNLDHPNWHAPHLPVQSDRFKTWNVFKQHLIRRAKC